MSDETSRFAYSEYIEANGVKLFTVVCLPEKTGKFPTVVCRSPYVDADEDKPEADICKARMREYGHFLDGGYAVVFQHCRGRGKSDGDCIPYVFERDDSLALYDWIRKQPFYDGGLYPCGASYTSTVHLVTAPFAPDIKAAIFKVQDSERYNVNYRNGFYKMGLHGGWYVGMYKKKSIPKKNFTTAAFNMLPLSDFSKTVFGEEAEHFNAEISHPDRDDPFWKTKLGGVDSHGAVKHANIPILLVTGFYDIYTGGVFDMWNSMDERTKAMSALAVHPYDHGGTGANQPILFEKGALGEAFQNYEVRFFDHARGKGKPPFELGKVTYFKLFGDEWCCDDFASGGSKLAFTLGEGETTYCYNPYDPASFKGGLSTNFGGCAWQDPPNSRYDIISVFTPEFDNDTFVKGKMKARLAVRSDCEDTCFYVRVSLCKPEGDYGLRDDINKISNFAASYRAGDCVEMDFSFDEHAFVIKKGEKLRVDISSSAYPLYVRHTNNKGLFSAQTTAKIAHNTVDLGNSYIELPTV